MQSGKPAQAQLSSAFFFNFFFFFFYGHKQRQARCGRQAVSVLLVAARTAGEEEWAEVQTEEGGLLQDCLTKRLPPSCHTSAQVDKSSPFGNLSLALRRDATLPSTNVKIIFEGTRVKESISSRTKVSSLVKK